MKRLGALLWRQSPLRALAEGWLICAGLVIPMLPILLEATHLARSLYLVLVPLACAVITALRLRFFPHRSVLTVAKECGLGIALGLGIYGIVMGLFVGLGHRDSITYSYAGTSGTTFFLVMAIPEYLGIRALSWIWQQWDQLRRRRYVWALTHAILSVAGGIGLMILAGFTFYAIQARKDDIWQIPPESPFAQLVYWLTLGLLLIFLLSVIGTVLVLPASAGFSFLVARKLTARLEKLTKATRALRQGDLAARLEVQGEDEIAQLQGDFNAMAADLGASMQALQAEKDKVWALLEARRDLVAGISHELRNPVAIILGYSDSLRRDGTGRPPEEVARDLETIHSEAARLNAILNDLLAASQLEAGPLRMAPQSVAVTGLAQRLVETFGGLAWNSKKVQITLSAPPNEVFVWADPLRLEQVLVNLVQNAVRHTSPGGVVAVEIQADPEHVTIEVEDTGAGIAPEDLPHIWEKYYQAGTPEGRASGGMGLGLSLVKELTEAMNGTASVESCPGQGSTFRIRLPARAPD